MEGGGETKKTVTCISSEPCVFGEDEGEGPYNLFMADREPSRAPGTAPCETRYQNARKSSQNMEMVLTLCLTFNEFPFG